MKIQTAPFYDAQEFSNSATYFVLDLSGNTPLTRGHVLALKQAPDDVEKQRQICKAWLWNEMNAQRESPARDLLIAFIKSPKRRVILEDYHMIADVTAECLSWINDSLEGQRWLEKMNPRGTCLSCGQHLPPDGWRRPLTVKAGTSGDERASRRFSKYKTAE